MVSLNPNKVIVNFGDGISMNSSIIPRFYIVTYSEKDDNININIIHDIKKHKINKQQSMAVGQWFKKNDEYLLYIYVRVYGNKCNIKEMNRLVRESIPTVITAIRLSEINLIKTYPNLDDSNIFIKFESNYDEYYKVENWGNLKNYKYIEENNEDDNELSSSTRSIPFRTKKEKIRLEENVILNLLNQHIETQLSTIYGKDIKYCIFKKEIIDIDEIKTIDSCGKSYEVSTLVKIKIKSEVTAIVMNFIIYPNKIIIKNINK